MLRHTLHRVRFTCIALLALVFLHGAILVGNSIISETFNGGPSEANLLQDAAVLDPSIAYNGAPSPMLSLVQGQPGVLGVLCSHTTTHMERSASVHSSP